MAENEIQAEKGARLHAIIEGRVQGVGFRAFVQSYAVDLGLTGWVRNRWDSSVEVTAEGPRQDLEKLLARLRRGSTSSYVSDVRTEWSDATGEFTGFRVKTTS